MCVLSISKSPYEKKSGNLFTDSRVCVCMCVCGKNEDNIENKIDMFYYWDSFFKNYYSSEMKSNTWSGGEASL